MKYLTFITVCAVCFGGSARASSTAASVAQDVMTNRDVGVASDLFGRESGCPNLVSADPVVLRAILDQTAREPFTARLNGVTWQVSRDTREEVQLAAPKLSASGAAELRFRGESTAGTCTYFHSALGKVGGQDLPQTKILKLTRVN